MDKIKIKESKNFLLWLKLRSMRQNVSIGHCGGDIYSIIIKDQQDIYARHCLKNRPFSTKYTPIEECLFIGPLPDKRTTFRIEHRIQYNIFPKFDGEPYYMFLVKTRKVHDIYSDEDLNKVYEAISQLMYDKLDPDIHHGYKFYSSLPTC